MSDPTDDALREIVRLAGEREHGSAQRQRQRDAAYIAALGTHGKAMAEELLNLRRERDELRDAKHDALGVLASLADCMNVANREEGLREVNNYHSLGDMRGGIDALVLHQRAKERKLAEELLRARELLTRVMQLHDSTVDDYHMPRPWVDDIRAFLARGEKEPHV